MRQDGCYKNKYRQEIVERGKELEDTMSTEEDSHFGEGGDVQLASTSAQS